MVAEGGGEEFVSGVCRVVREGVLFDLRKVARILTLGFCGGYVLSVVIVFFAFGWCCYL